MGYLNDFITLGFISLFAAMSPGPDFFIVAQSSLSYGKRSGMFTSLGVACGCLIHASYCILGLGVLVSESLTLFNVLKYLGAGYLIYLGLKAIFNVQSQAALSPSLSSQKISNVAAFKKGLLVNLLNPKVTLFILSVFTQLIDPATPLSIQALFGIELGLIALLWFALLSLILNNSLLKTKLQSVQHVVDKILGVFLILLGIKVAISFN